MYWKELSVRPNDHELSSGEELPLPVLPEELAVSDKAEKELHRRQKREALIATVKMNLELGITPGEEILKHYGPRNYRQVEATLKQRTLSDSAESPEERQEAA